MKRILTLLLFISQSAIAYTGYKTNSEISPIELQYMMQTLSSYNKTHPNENTEDVDQKLKTLNDLMIQFQKAENYFIFKTETYKAVYEITPGRNFESNGVTFRYKLLNHKYEKYRNEYPFFYFLINGLFTDYELFLEEKSKKTRLATPWLNFLNENELENSIVAIRGLILQIIDRIIVKLQFYSFESDNFKKTGDLITFENLKEEQPTTDISSIAEKVIQKAKEQFSSTPEFTFKNLPISELFPDPDPNYTAPEKLPEPINDWKN